MCQRRVRISLFCSKARFRLQNGRKRVGDTNQSFLGSSAGGPSTPSVPHSSQFIAMSGRRSLAVHSDSISTTSRKEAHPRHLCPIHRSFIAMSGRRSVANHSDSISTTSRQEAHPRHLCPIHRSFIAMSGRRSLAVHSDSISTTPRSPVA